MWAVDKKHGQGTFWRIDNGKLRREYTGDWYEDRRHGRGTFFYTNGDRYDGYWVNGSPQGEGRMIYSTENIYEGQWHEGKRNGYGVLTKRNGDHFEGHWVNGQREGQGSYFYHDKNKLFVGEWCEDQPKVGVYTQVDDEEAEKRPKKPHFMDKYILPDIDQLKLIDPTAVLEKAMERVKQDRASFRVQHIPIEEMFTSAELMDLRQCFESVSIGEAFVNLEALKMVFNQMGYNPSEERLLQLLETCGKKDDEDIISFELFARTLALTFEEEAEKVSTSSQNDNARDSQAQMMEMIEQYGPEGAMQMQQ